MIHSIHSSLPSFKPQSFKPGLNILLADKTTRSTDKSTRNGAGKSSLVEIVHFLLGANVDSQSLFKTEALIHQQFEMTFDLGGQQITVKRSGDAPSKVYVNAEENKAWPTRPAVKDGGLTNEAWKEILGTIMFGLSPKEGSHHPQPSFRTLLPYFARRVAEKGFGSFEKFAEQVQPWQYQLSLSYLLGLDWAIAGEWQEVRAREKDLKALAKATGSHSVLGQVLGTRADLRTTVVVAEAEVSKLRKQLASFQVLPQYEQTEREASRLTREINELADANTIDRKLILDLTEALKRETPPPANDLGRLYNEAGVIIAEAALRRFEEVKAFHDSVISNRRDYLSSEKAAADQRIQKREREQAIKDSRRAELMRLLQTHGALEHYNELRSELVKRETEVESLKQRMQVAERLESGKTELHIERQNLVQRLRNDLNERKEFVDEAILAFEETSRQLYERAGAGHLNIDVSDNGPQFKITVPSGRSVGIKNMHIYCFDMMLMRLCAKRGIGPGFLIHDSHLFDGVDGRQVVHALEVGARTAEELGFQYIVTMNSDDLYKEASGSFDLEKYVLNSRLTDASEDGGLFGLRFN
ncbi:MAG: DUF2326 domain-containing protein [Flavobacteriales bacterium]|nr:DUF2326 domain-containing protein [Flavobacteriales bacterium]